MCEKTIDFGVCEGETVQNGIIFRECSEFGYAKRTVINASAFITLAFASDFSTPGERLTKEAARGKHYFQIKMFEELPDKTLSQIIETLNTQSECVINIAGNCISHLGGEQEKVDEFILNVLKKIKTTAKLKIRSGGQSGADEAGAKAGASMGLPTLVLAPRGWCWRNRDNEDIRNKESFMSRFNPEQITIHNLKSLKPEDGNDYKCDMGTDLGNPFYMATESQRDEVCQKYSKYFKDNKLWLTPQFQGMLKKVKAGQHIRLFCWCAPKKCHCETIKKALLYFKDLKGRIVS